MQWWNCYGGIGKQKGVDTDANWADYQLHMELLVSLQRIYWFEFIVQCCFVPVKLAGWQGHIKICEMCILHGDETKKGNQ